MSGDKDRAEELGFDDEIEYKIWYENLTPEEQELEDDERWQKEIRRSREQDYKIAKGRN